MRCRKSNGNKNTHREKQKNSSIRNNKTKPLVLNILNWKKSVKIKIKYGWGMSRDSNFYWEWRCQKRFDKECIWEVCIERKCMMKCASVFKAIIFEKCYSKLHLKMSVLEKTLVKNALIMSTMRNSMKSKRALRSCQWIALDRRKEKWKLGVSLCWS